MGGRITGLPPLRDDVASEIGAPAGLLYASPALTVVSGARDESWGTRDNVRTTHRCDAGSRFRWINQSNTGGQAFQNEKHGVGYKQLGLLESVMSSAT